MKRGRRIGLIILGIIGITFVYRVLSVYQFRTGECIATPEVLVRPPTYPRRIVMMTYNIQGHASLVRGNHIEKIAETINKIHPDIVAINEAHKNTWQSRFRDHVEELSRRTRMNAVFGESYQQLGGQFGNAILTRGQIVSHDVYKLPGIGEPRTLLESLITIDGGTVQVYVTHLAAWEKLNRTVRREQLTCLSRHVRASRYPYILAGDLNAPPESPEIKDFRGDVALQMCGTGLEPTHKLMGIQIDYIFADSGWKCSGATLDVGPSDHRPVVAELTHEAN